MLYSRRFQMMNKPSLYDVKRATADTAVSAKLVHILVQKKLKPTNQQNHGFDYFDEEVINIVEESSEYEPSASGRSEDTLMQSDK